MPEAFEKLQNRILSDAKLKADAIIKEAEDKARGIVDEAKTRARNEADQILLRAKLDAEALRRSILSTKVRANRLRLLEEKNKIISSIVSDIEGRLAAIAQSGAFADSLKRMAAEAANAVGSDQPILRVGFTGISKKEAEGLEGILPRGAKLVIEDEPIDGIGGVIASDPEGRVVYNNSFRSRLDRMDAQLLSTISSIVFGE